MKKIISIVLVILMFASIITVNVFSVSAQELVTIYADNVTVSAGESVQVPVYIKNNSGIKYTTITLKYDSSMLTPVSTSRGDVFSSGNYEDSLGGNNEKDGEISVYWSSNTQTTNDGILFYVLFQADCISSGITSVTIDYDEYDTGDENYNAVIFDCKTFDINFIGTAEQQYSVFTFTASDVVAGEEFEVLLNADNICNLSSVDLKLNYDSNYFEYLSFDSNDTAVAKVNCLDDGLIINLSNLEHQSGSNSILTLRFKSSENIKNGYYFLMAQCENAVGNDLIVVNGVTLELGDSVLYSDEIRANYGDIINVPIKIEYNKGLSSFLIRFSYNDEQIELLNAEAGASFPGINFSNTDSGNFFCIWANDSGNVIENGTVLNLQFKVITEESITSTICISYEQENTQNDEEEDVVLLCNNVEVVLNRIPVVIGLELKSKPDKLIYELYDEFEPNGMVVNAIMDDGTTETINDKYNITGFDSNSVGLKTVTITYEGQFASFDIEVIHTHRWSEWTVVILPSCEENGIERRECKICNESEAREISSLGHDYECTIIKEAACTENGEKVYICKNDGTHTYTETIPMSGHTFGEWETVLPASCEENGIEKRECKICNESETREISPLGHDYECTIIKEAACTENGEKVYICKNDGTHTYTEIIPMLGHTFGEWIIDKNASRSKPGEKHRICTVCGYVETEIIEPNTNLGDVNCDGKYNINDAAVIQLYKAKLYIGEFDESVADVNGDGMITISDAAYIQLDLAKLL